MKPSVEDVVELQQLSAEYAVRMSQGDVEHVMQHVFTPDGSYSAFGEVYALADWPALVDAAPKGLFLCGAPAVRVTGDTGTGEVPLLMIDQTTHNMRMGWYSDTYRRTEEGWRLVTRKMTFLRKHGGADSGNPHDPLRPAPTSS